MYSTIVYWMNATVTKSALKRKSSSPENTIAFKNRETTPLSYDQRMNKCRDVTHISH